MWLVYISRLPQGSLALLTHLPRHHHLPKVRRILHVVALHEPVASIDPLPLGDCQAACLVHRPADDRQGLFLSPALGEHLGAEPRSPVHLRSLGKNIRHVVGCSAGGFVAVPVVGGDLVAAVMRD